MLTVTMSAEPLVVEATAQYLRSLAVGVFLMTTVGVFLLDILIRGVPGSHTAWGQQIFRSVSFGFLGLILILCTNSNARRVRLELRDDAVLLPRPVGRIEVPWEEVASVVLRAEERFPYRETLDLVLRDGTNSARRLGTVRTVLLSGATVRPSTVELDISRRQPELEIIRLRP